MKKPIMKFLTLACAAAMLPVPAAAAPIDGVRQDNVKRQVVIAGSLDASCAGRGVTVALLPEDKASLAEPEFSDFSYLKQTALDQNGGYQAAFALESGSGSYVARVYIDGMAAAEEKTFAFYSFAEADAYLEQINAGDPAGLKTLLEAHRAEIGIDTGLYRAMLSGGHSLTRVYQAAAEHADFSSLGEFILFFEEQLRLAAAGTGDSEIARLLVEENAALWQGLLAYESYGAMDESVRRVVYEKLGNLPFENDASLKAAFVQAVLLAQIQTQAWQGVMSLLKGPLDPEAGLSLTNFNRYPSEVSKAIAGERYDSVRALQTAMDSVKGGSGNSGGHGGTGSGGGGGGGFTSKGEEPGSEPVQPEEADKSFHDLEGYDWAKPGIEALAQRGILNGVAENQFAPGAQVTREEFVAMLVRAFPMRYSGGPADFADVPTGAWFEQVVAAAQENGIVNGIGGGFFGIGRPITREELAKMAFYTLEKLAGTEVSGSSAVFTDETAIADWARPSVDAMAELGIINGYEDGGFHPQDNATRAEAAKIIYGMLQRTGGIEA